MMKDLKPYYIDEFNIKITPAAGIKGTRGISYTSKLLLNTLKKQSNLDTILDYGAGIGMLSLPLSKISERIECIEWDLRAIRVLNNNIKNNNISNINVHLSDTLENITDITTVVIDAPVHLGREFIIEMIHRSHKLLNKKGTLFFIARRNFGAKWYHKYLKNVFEDVEVLDITGGFRTLKCSSKISLQYLNFNRKFSVPSDRNNYVLTTRPGIFSRKKIDIGSKHLIDYGRSKNRGTVVDFGSGYGAISILMSDMSEKIISVECNLRAFKCLTFNTALNKISNIELNFNSDLSMYDNEIADLFLVNPPTHSGGLTADLILSESFRILKNNAKLAVVVYRTGGYLQRMKSIFKNVQQLDKGNYKILISEK